MFLESFTASLASLPENLQASGDVTSGPASLVVASGTQEGRFDAMQTTSESATDGFPEGLLSVKVLTADYGTLTGEYVTLTLDLELYSKLPTVVPVEFGGPELQPLGDPPFYNLQAFIYLDPPNYGNANPDFNQLEVLLDWRYDASQDSATSKSATLSDVYVADDLARPFWFALRVTASTWSVELWESDPQLGTGQPKYEWQAPAAFTGEYLWSFLEVTAASGGTQNSKAEVSDWTWNGGGTVTPPAAPPGSVVAGAGATGALHH